MEGASEGEAEIFRAQILETPLDSDLALGLHLTFETPQTLDETQDENPHATAPEKFPLRWAGKIQENACHGTWCQRASQIWNLLCLQTAATEVESLYRGRWSTCLCTQP